MSKTCSTKLSQSLSHVYTIYLDVSQLPCRAIANHITDAEQNKNNFQVDCYLTISFLLTMFLWKQQQTAASLSMLSRSIFSLAAVDSINQIRLELCIYHYQPNSPPSQVFTFWYVLLCNHAIGCNDEGIFKKGKRLTYFHNHLNSA